MNDEEKARALYDYVTATVEYDERYYAGDGSMPLESTTAYGALFDGVAICGGYSYAVQALFEEAGIPCHLVTGSWNGENHMWNVARLNGEWLYFDATADRGSGEWARYFAVPADKLYGHVWEEEVTELLEQ